MTTDTVTPDTLREGATAHAASEEVITGLLSPAIQTNTRWLPWKDTDETLGVLGWYRVGYAKMTGSTAVLAMINGQFNNVSPFIRGFIFASETDGTAPTVNFHNIVIAGYPTIITQVRVVVDNTVKELYLDVNWSSRFTSWCIASFTVLINHDTIKDKIFRSYPREQVIKNPEILESQYVFEHDVTW